MSVTATNFLFPAFATPVNLMGGKEELFSIFDFI